MQIALICAYCNKVHSDADGATLVVDFKQKHMTFICMNKDCKRDNDFDFGDFVVQSKKAPLPRMRMI